MSVDINTSQKVEKLRKQIDDLRHRYHVENDPQVTDRMYEGLMDKLRKLEEKYPELVTKSSPTQRIAGIPLDKFHKVRHTVKQWSFNDAFSEDDIVKWEERILKILEKNITSRPKDLEYICELKIDGLHIVLTYEDGVLVNAATRGDGVTGEDVTQNIKTIMSVPLKLREKEDLITEGEVWMNRKHFAALNKQRQKDKEPLFANPRNASAGTIRQLDPNIVRKRKLDLIAYEISSKDREEKQSDVLKKLKRLGFLTDQNWKVCRNIEEILQFHKKWEKKKDSQPFWVDGVVIKVNNKKYRDILSYTGKAPRWAIAFKFPAEQGTTKITDIYWQVGRTGALTPVALMEPVKLAGTTVTHATLHNYDEIQRLGVKIGDSVVVEKAGDIIPKVVRVLEKMRDGVEKIVRKPSRCPICNEEVQRREVIDKKQGVSAGIFCLNNNCYAKELKNIIHFVSKKAFNIDGLGKKIVEQLLNEGLIKNPADIFILTVGDLKPLERFATKAAQNLVDSVKKAKEISLSRFIYSLGINNVGEETAIALAKHFKKLDQIINAGEEELENITDIGPQVAKSIKQYFRDKHNLELVDELKKNGIIIKKEKEISNNTLNGKIFVLTGSLKNMSRDGAKQIIRDNGGDISSSVSKQTDYVLVGEKPGSKAQKAKDLGVTVISEIDFEKMVKKKGKDKEKNCDFAVFLSYLFT